ERGRAYARSGHVLDCETVSDDDGLEIRGRVSGNRARPYLAEVGIEIDDHGAVEVWGSCTCPVGQDCKHCVALLVTAGTRTAPRPARHLRAVGSTPVDERPPWERVVTGALDRLDADRAALAAPTTIPLGLEISHAAVRGSDGLRVLRIRPV